MLVHRAADVEKQQHFHVIVPFWQQFQIEHAGVARRGANRVIEIQLFGGTLAGELTQTP